MISGKSIFVGGWCRDGSVHLEPGCTIVHRFETESIINPSHRAAHESLSRAIFEMALHGYAVRHLQSEHHGATPLKNLVPLGPKVLRYLKLDTRKE